MRIRELRKHWKLTQQEAAERLNIERTSYARYELGLREPDIATLIAMADLFQVSLDYLCERSNVPASPFQADNAPAACAPAAPEQEHPANEEEKKNPPIAPQAAPKEDMPQSREALERFVLEVLQKKLR